MADLGTAGVMPLPAMGPQVTAITIPITGSPLGSAAGIMPLFPMPTASVTAYGIAGTLGCPECPPPPGPPTDGQVWPLTYVQG